MTSTVRRRTWAATTIVLALGLAMLAPVAAHAAKPNPWTAYLWPAGATCTYDMAYADGSTEAEQVQVKKRTKRMVRIRWSTPPIPQTWTMASGGRMVELERSVRGDTVIVTKETYPTVAQTRSRRGTTALTVTRRVKYSAREAKGFLVSGRTMLVTATYGVHGLGEKTLTLPSGPVSAIGVGIRLRSLKIMNVRKKYVGGVKNFYRASVKSAESEEWWAKGRGVVLWIVGSGSDSESTTQRSCA